MLSEVFSEVSRVGVVVIGRNEGERLKACLRSISKSEGATLAVYVDSGSEDGSQKYARGLGLDVVELDTSIPFTAARARNAGWRRLLERQPGLAWIQFLDGDCVLQPNWLSTAVAKLAGDYSLAVVCGRRREIYPEASIYNAMIDCEWDTPVGAARACGGDALYLREALEQVNGFDESLIAGEEPELCYRLRHAGWKVERIDCEMTLHDANITSFRQWWRRAIRTGWVWADASRRYGSTPERFRVKEFRRVVLTTMILPFSLLFGLFLTPWAFLLLVVYPLQLLKNYLKPWRKCKSHRLAVCLAFYSLISRFAELQGIVKYWWSRCLRNKVEIIEYKA